MSRIAHPKPARKRKPTMKSSEEARDLLRGLLRRGKRNERTLRQVARLLGLPNHGQVQMMLAGKMRDTPAMKVALRRADKRYYNPKTPACNVVDADALRTAVGELERTLNYLKSLLPEAK